MQNLTYPVKRVLINTLSVTEVGLIAVTDPDLGGTAVQHLIFKKWGIDIPKTSTTTVRKSCTQAGQLKSVALTIDAPAPCEDCNYEYQIGIKKLVKNPGVLNDDYYPKPRWYGGRIEAIQTPSGGELADADKITIENAIINGITEDVTGDTRDHAIVEARRIYIITTGVAGTEKVELFNSAGTSIVNVTLTNDATIIGAVNDLNIETTFDDYFKAVAVSSTALMIYSINPGLIYTIADGGGAGTAITIDSREIWIKAKDVDEQFEVEYEMGFATQRGLTLQYLDASTNDAGTIAYTTIVAGVAHANSYTAGGHAAADYVQGINTDVATYGGYACLPLTAANDIVFYGNGNIEDHIWTSFGATGIVKDDYTSWCSSTGKFPRLTSDDVFRIFMGEKHLGDKSIFTYLDQPTDGATYCKLTFTYYNEIGDILGASHQNDHKMVVEVYIKSGLFATSIWDASGYMWENQADAAIASGTFTPDTAWDTLLDTWYGADLLYSWPS